MTRILSATPGLLGIAAAAILLTAAPAAAQTGKVTGVVTDQATGEPLANASVFIDGTGRGSLTQDNGRFFIINVPPGTYTLVAELIGYASERRENVAVSIDVTVQQNFQLATEAIALGEVIVSTSRTPLVVEGQTGSLEMISRDEIDALPVTDIMGVLELEQGFLQVPEDNTTVVSFAQQRQGVTALRIRGGRGAETTVMIDGIPINNFALGGPAFDITNKAIEQVAIFTGQLDVQYGNALSGVVNYATPEGSDELQGELEFRSSEVGGWLGNQYDQTRGFDMFEGVISGPIPMTGDNLRFLIAGRQRYGAARAYEFDYDVFDPSNPSADFNTPDPNDVIPGWRATGFDEVRDGYAKLTYYATPAAKLNLSWAGYEREYKPYDFDWTLAVNPLEYMTTATDSAYYLARTRTLDYQNLVQNSLRLDRNLFIARWDHTFGRSAYKITVGRFDQSRETCNVMSGVCLQNHYEDPNFNGGFVAPGPAVYNNTPTAGTDRFWGGESVLTTTGRFDFQSQVSDNHNISGGVFYQGHDLTYDEWDDVGVNDVVKLHQLFEAQPWDGAVYIQDQIEYDFLTLKLGARFDYGRASGLFFANPVDPTNGTTALDVCSNPSQWQNVTVREYDPATETVSTSTLSADPSWTLAGCTFEVRDEATRIASSDDFSEADTRSQFSPRIGVSFPVTESSSLFLNFQRLSQNPILINNYRNSGIGTTREGTIAGPAIFVNASAGQTPFLGNPHLVTEQATTYEIGYSQEIDGQYALSAVIFSKDQSGLTGVARVGSPPYTVIDPGATYGFSAPDYAILTNQDFATTRGIEIALRRRVENYWGFDVNYGLSACRTNAADPEREFEAQTDEDDPFIRDEIPCEIDQPHKFTGVFRLAVRDDVPDIPFGDVLANTNLSVIFSASSGLPYTPTLTFEGFGELEQFDRYSGRAPMLMTLNMQARKDWTINNVRYGFFVNVNNLTDRLNCIQVYESTGKCTDGSEDQDRRRAGNTVGDNTDSTFFDRPHFIGQRRTITAGMRVTF